MHRANKPREREREREEESIDEVNDNETRRRRDTTRCTRARDFPYSLILHQVPLFLINLIRVPH